MRRSMLGGLVALMALVLTACPTATPPGYSPPKVVSVDVAPAPVQAGGTVTITIEATSALSINGAFARFLITPSGNSLSAGDFCEMTTTPLGSFRHVQAVATCDVPTFATNGTWRLEYYLNDSEPPTGMRPGLTARAAFEVAGGTEDRRPPQLLSHSFEPTVVDQETTFTLHLRLRDDAPARIGRYYRPMSFVFQKLFSPQSTFLCGNPIYSPVSATDVDVLVTCTPQLYQVSGRAEAGPHQTSLLVSDALGHEGTYDLAIDVQPAP